MEDRRTIPLSLGAGETRRLLLEAGSTVMVLSGQLVWRDPLAWVAESIIANAQLLGSEEARVVARGALLGGVGRGGVGCHGAEFVERERAVVVTDAGLAEEDGAAG